MVQNPTTLCRELIGGTYTQVSWGRQSVLMALAYADATDGRYLQTYLNPTLTGGRLSFDATIEWYEPLERSATRQLSANPASLLERVERRLALGVASTLDVARSSTPPRRVGPVDVWTVKWGDVPGGAPGPEYGQGDRGADRGVGGVLTFLASVPTFAYGPSTRWHLCHPRLP